MYLKNSRRLLALSCAGAVFSLSQLSLAQPFASTEARSLAMGDTGVASARPDAAPLFNSAMLSEKPKGNIQIILPNVGLSVFADPDAMNAFENIDDEGYADSLTRGSEIMNNGIISMDSTQFLQGKEQVVQAAKGLDSELNALSDKPFRVNGGLYTSVAFPTSFAGIAVFANINATIETAPTIDACDRQTLREYGSFLGAINNEADIQTALNTGVPPYTYRCPGDTADRTIIDSNTPPGIVDPSSDLATHVTIAGVTVSEYGVAIAHQFDFGGHKVSIGLTPKIQNLTSYWAVPTVDDLDDDNYDIADELEASEKEENGFNMDLGIATSFLPGDALTLGLSIKNLMQKEYSTNAANSGRVGKYSIDRQIRAGIAWDAPMGITLAADMDLTSNDPYFLGDKTRFLAMGAEWDILKIIKLRGGLRKNMENSDDQTFTMGLGFNILAVHIDLTGQAGDNSAGGAAQFGINF